MSVTITDKRRVASEEDDDDLVLPERDLEHVSIQETSDDLPDFETNDILDAPPWWAVFGDVDLERRRQIGMWGEQSALDGTGNPYYIKWAKEYRHQNDARAAANRKGVWAKILLEEVFEALSERDAAELRAELVQVAAVAVSWIEDIDRRADA